MTLSSTYIEEFLPKLFSTYCGYFFLYAFSARVHVEFQYLYISSTKNQALFREPKPFESLLSYLLSLLRLKSFINMNLSIVFHIFFFFTCITKSYQKIYTNLVGNVLVSMVHVHSWMSSQYKVWHIYIVCSSWSVQQQLRQQHTDLNQAVFNKKRNAKFGESCKYKKYRIKERLNIRVVGKLVGPRK